MTVFVGGVHAVGKTFMLRPLCEELGVLHATASQLIREQRGSVNWTTSREVDEVERNQQALVVAVNQLREHGKRVVLDGHFVLRRSINIHERISLETFGKLGIEGVILLETSYDVIWDRLRERGDATWALSEIEAFAYKESEHAHAVCLEFGMPLIRLQSPAPMELKAALVSLGA